MAAEDAKGAVGRPRNDSRFLERRDEIADIAARLFAAKGYHATSIQELTAATGLQRGALYHYIDKKRDLLYWIHERFIEPLLASAREIEAKDQGPSVALREMADALMGTIDEYHDQVTVFLHEWNAIAAADDWQDVRRARREFEEIVQRLIERGVREGEFSVSDSRLATLAFLGMINYSYQWFRSDGRYSADTIANSFSDIFLQGITR